jgi:5'-deoxynucleotidase YfbR-like HD superfamily hydrolase
MDINVAESTKKSSWASLIEASSGNMRRLSSVWRFSSIPVVGTENVAEHSYWVAIYAAMIHRHIAGENCMVLMSQILLKALTHDIGEANTGDVIRTFKYSTPELKKEIDRAEGILLKNFPNEIANLFVETDGSCHNLDKYIEVMVKAADFLSLFQFMRREAMKSNYEIRPFFTRMCEDLNMMAMKSDHTICEYDGETYDFDGAAFYATLAEESIILRSSYLPV